MRKLLPVVGIMLGFALACGGSDTDEETPVISVEPQKPTEPAEPEKPAEPTTKTVTETISESVTIEANKKAQLNALGRREIVSKAKAMGYSNVSNIKVGEASCSAKTCTATVTGTITKTVTVEPEDAEEAEEAEGEGGEE